MIPLLGFALVFIGSKPAGDMRFLRADRVIEAWLKTGRRAETDNVRHYIKGDETSRWGKPDFLPRLRPLDS
jgi:hypothetical protein